MTVPRYPVRGDCLAGARAWLEYRQEVNQGLTRALSKGDAPVRDYRTTSREETG